MRSSLWRSVVCGCLLLISTTAFGQFELNLGKSKAAASDEPKITVTSEPKSPKTGDVLTLKVGINVPKGAYTYSMKEGFSGRTKVTLSKIAGVEPVEADFSVNQKPKLKEHPASDTPVETFEGNVVWSRKFKVTDAAAFEMVGTLKIQVCDESSCRPLSHKIALGGGGDATIPSGNPNYIMTYAPTEKGADGERPGPVEWTVKLSPSDAQAGDKVTLEVSAKVREGFHIFALDQDPKNYGKPTAIKPETLEGIAPVNVTDLFKASREPELHQSEGKEQRIYHEGVTFTRSFTVTKDAMPGKFGVAGLVTYQVCTQSNCRSAKFEFAVGAVTPKKNVAVSGTGATGEASSANASTSGTGLSQLLDGLTYVNYGETETEMSLALYLFYAFLGGMILNVMPCVLPVIAIKALGFAQQAGESRGRVLALNGAYSVGVISVFVLLASLAAFVGLKWGGLFQQVEFNIAMCVLVFAMGLSLLGVFEVPVPGFVGSAAGAHHKEGLGGAFFTGIFATILATPCSGPFLGPVLGWSVKQSPAVIYVVWTMIGVGMSFPYLVFGLFPKAVKMLPKPGNWMIRFKQFAGFCLLGTAVYLLSTVNESFRLPTIVMLFGVSFGLWMIGNLYDYSSTNRRRWGVRACSFAAMFGISWFGFATFARAAHWESFEADRVLAALKSQRPVVIDFTADWCLTCKFVERTTLDTRETKALLVKHDFAAFRADWTDGDEVISSVLNKFDASSIPVLAVISPSRPKEAVILRDAWTQETLHQVLKQAASGQKTLEGTAQSSSMAQR